MRICMLSWRGCAHPNAGGAEAYTEMVLQGLRDRGHQVTWYVGDPGSGRKTAASDSGIRMVYGSAGMRVYWSGHYWAKKHAAEFDVIIDQLNTFGFVAPKVAPQVVALIHQLALDVWDYECPPGVSHVGRLVEQQVLRQYRHTPFVTVSESTLADLHDHGWQGEGHIIPNVLPSTIQRMDVPKSVNPSLIFLGRLGSKAKRLDHAEDILMRVRKTVPTAELWVVGRGEAPNGLARTPGVKVYPTVDSRERDRLLASAWCLLATSVREGWGRMVMEAAAQGTPSIVYDVPGLRDAVLSGLTGLVVPPLIEAAAATVTKALGDPDGLSRMGQEALQRLPQDAAKGFVAEWEAVVTGLVMRDYLSDEREGVSRAL